MSGFFEFGNVDSSFISLNTKQADIIKEIFDRPIVHMVKNVFFGAALSNNIRITVGANEEYTLSREESAFMHVVYSEFLRNFYDYEHIYGVVPYCIVVENLDSNGDGSEIKKVAIPRIPDMTKGSISLRYNQKTLYNQYRWEWNGESMSDEQKSDHDMKFCEIPGSHPNAEGILRTSLSKITKEYSYVREYELKILEDIDRALVTTVVLDYKELKTDSYNSIPMVNFFHDTGQIKPGQLATATNSANSSVFSQVRLNPTSLQSKPIARKTQVELAGEYTDDSSYRYRIIQPTPYTTVKEFHKPNISDIATLSRPENMYSGIDKDISLLLGYPLSFAQDSKNLYSAQIQNSNIYTTHCLKGKIQNYENIMKQVFIELYNHGDSTSRFYLSGENGIHIDDDDFLDLTEESKHYWMGMLNVNMKIDPLHVSTESIQLMKELYEDGAINDDDYSTVMSNILQMSCNATSKRAQKLNKPPKKKDQSNGRGKKKSVKPNEPNEDKEEEEEEEEEKSKAKREKKKEKTDAERKKKKSKKETLVDEKM